MTGSQRDHDLASGTMVGVEAEEFSQRVAEIVLELVRGMDGVANVERQPELWLIEPVRAEASPLWIAGDDPWSLTVGFGRAGSRMELGFSDKIPLESELAELEDVCVSVMEGRLTEWRRGKRGSRWRLVMADGDTQHGSTNWFLPRPWAHVVEERFSPYR